MILPLQIGVLYETRDHVVWRILRTDCTTPNPDYPVLAESFKGKVLRHFTADGFCLKERGICNALDLARFSDKNWKRPKKSTKSKASQ